MSGFHYLFIGKKTRSKLTKPIRCRGVYSSEVLLTRYFFLTILYFSIPALPFFSQSFSSNSQNIFFNSCLYFVCFLFLIYKFFFSFFLYFFYSFFSFNKNLRNIVIKVQRRKGKVWHKKKKKKKKKKKSSKIK